MKIFYSPYELTPQSNFSGVYRSSIGFLLKLINEDGEVRYSLYHPIEELGDPSLRTFLEDQKIRNFLIEKIKKLTLSSVCQKDASVSTYALAASKESLSNEANQLERSGFKTVKLKASKLEEIDFDFLEELPFQYIFDFNGRESVKNFSALPDLAKKFLKTRVKYIEDPYPKIQKREFKLASDFIDYKEHSDYKIIKPTGFAHDFSLVGFQAQDLVATSYLDHPVGQLLSAVWASDHSLRHECGLWTHTLYKKNDYSKLFGNRSSISLSLVGEFLQLLQKEKWKAV